MHVIYWLILNLINYCLVDDDESQFFVRGVNESDIIIGLLRFSILALFCHLLEKWRVTIVSEDRDQTAHKQSIIIVYSKTTF